MHAETYKKTVGGKVSKMFNYAIYSIIEIFSRTEWAEQVIYQAHL